MTRVRIAVDDRLLGDIEATVDDEVTDFDRVRGRQVIGYLLRDASEKIRRAYDISEEAAE